MATTNTVRYAITDGERFQSVAVDKRRKVRRETGRSSPIILGSVNLPALCHNLGYAFLVRVRAK